MQPKTTSRRRKPAGLLERIGLALAVLIVATFYAIGFVREITGKYRGAGPEKPATGIIKGQIQPPLPGSAKTSAGEEHSNEHADK